mmetsp:Transcript_48195/g.56337  ORF Transcript_48195/g.56337 Transcript_48195/m.56337 type:complete len:105 (+) Transcript_48195:888-1202(+)
MDENEQHCKQKKKKKTCNCPIRRHRRRRHEKHSELLQMASSLLFLETSIGKAFTPMLAPLLSPHKRPPKIQYTYREKKINKGKKEGAINGKICVENVMSDANVD